MVKTLVKLKPQSIQQVLEKKHLATSPTSLLILVLNGIPVATESEATHV